MTNKVNVSIIKDNTEYGKIPPQAVDVEEAILSILLYNTNKQYVIVNMFAEMFYKEAHQHIFTAISELYDNNKPIDTITVCEQLKKNEALELAGGVYYITTLSDKLGSVGGVDYYVLILKEKYIERELIKVSSEVTKSAFDDSSDVFDNITFLENELDKIQNVVNDNKNSKEFKEILNTCVSELEKRIELNKTGKISGVSTGLFDLDKRTNGWQNKDLIILAARPSMGKTALALFFSKSAGLKDVPVCFFSLEMSDVKLADRLVLSETNISAENYRSGKINVDELNEIKEVTKKIRDRKLFIYDVSGINTNYIKSVCRTKKRKGECGLIVIDYLQLVNSTLKGGNKNNMVEDITKKTKELAKELDVPVILLCQLSRDVEKRGGNKVPMLSDLRDSGGIEQDADIVAFIHRPDYYGIMGEDGESLKGKGEIIIAKYRDGSLGSIPFKHNDSLTQIYDYYENNFNEPVYTQQKIEKLPPSKSFHEVPERATVKELPSLNEQREMKENGVPF